VPRCAGWPAMFATAMLMYGKEPAGARCDAGCVRTASPAERARGRTLPVASERGAGPIRPAPRSSSRRPWTRRRPHDRQRGCCACRARAAARAAAAGTAGSCASRAQRLQHRRRHLGDLRLGGLHASSSSGWLANHASTPPGGAGAPPSAAGTSRGCRAGRSRRG
jgi:hypothetical protein